MRTKDGDYDRTLCMLPESNKDEKLTQDSALLAAAAAGRHCPWAGEGKV
jgi:hypothetical protein